MIHWSLRLALGDRFGAEVTDSSYFVWLYVKFIFRFVWPDKHQRP